MNAVERYMLGDLSVSEVEEYERHFFDCPQCSEELRALTIFRENARAVFAEQDLDPVPASVTEPKSKAGWWGGFSPVWHGQWAAALGALLIGIFAGYLAFSSRESVQAVSAYPLYAQARGEETVVSPAASSKFYTLYLDKTWDGNYTHYWAVVRDLSGTKEFTVLVEPGAAGDAIHVLVPTRKLAAGKYELVISAFNHDKRSELARFPFTLRFQ